LSNYLFLEN